MIERHLKFEVFRLRINSQLAVLQDMFSFIFAVQTEWNMCSMIWLNFNCTFILNFFQWEFNHFFIFFFYAFFFGIGLHIKHLLEAIQAATTDVDVSQLALIGFFPLCFEHCIHCAPFYDYNVKFNRFYSNNKKCIIDSIVSNNQTNKM